MRIGNESGSRFFKNGHGLLPSHRRKIVQKDVERITTFQVIE